MLAAEETVRDIEAERTALERAFDGKTLCSELARTASVHAELPMLSWKEGGWHSLTFREARDQVRAATLGLAALGLRRGEFGLVLTGNRPEHVLACQALVHAGATPVSIYEAIAASQLAYIANHCEATVAVVDADRLPMLLGLRPQLPHMKLIVVCGGQMELDFGGGAIGWEELLERGEEEHERDPLAFEAAAQRVSPDDIATVIYTSGTTGPPKGVVLTHRFALCWVEMMNQRAPVAPGDRVVSYLPLAHCTSQWLTQWQPVVSATSTYFCADPADLVATLREVRPTQLLGVPRVWEKLHAGLAGGTSLESIGLDRCRIPIICAAPAAASLIALFHRHGLPLSDGWGMTELGFGTWNGLERIRPGTIGVAMPGVELRLADGGELLARGPCMMDGYYKDPARTAETIDGDGWLHTGDLAACDEDGYYRIVGRKKELIITNAGKNISPINIEAMLREHPLVAQCCVVGDGRDHLTALIVFDPVRAAGRDAIADMHAHITVVNERLSAAEQLVAFTILHKHWTVEGEELTPTLKLRRAAVERKYASEIEAMYLPQSSASRWRTARSPVQLRSRRRDASLVTARRPSQDAQRLDA
jgi:long-chain acyl-CoA synthetase